MPSNCRLCTQEMRYNDQLTVKFSVEVHAPQTMNANVYGLSSRSTVSPNFALVYKKYENVKGKLAYH